MKTELDNIKSILENKIISSINKIETNILSQPSNNSNHDQIITQLMTTIEKIDQLAITSNSLDKKFNTLEQSQQHFEETVIKQNSELTNNIHLKELDKSDILDKLESMEKSIRTSIGEQLSTLNSVFEKQLQPFIKTVNENIIRVESTQSGYIVLIYLI